MNFEDVSAAENRFMKSIWASSASDVEALREAIRSGFQVGQLVHNDAWIAIVGGRPFGCELVEEMFAYKRVLDDNVPTIAEVRDRLAGVGPDAMNVLLRTVRRVTPPTLTGLLENSTRFAINELLGNGLADIEVNRKGINVLRDTWNFRPAVRYEFMRRNTLWELVGRYAAFEWYNIRDLRNVRDSLTHYELKGGNECCEVCRKWEGKEFPVDRDPGLPHMECKNPTGCKCYISGVSTIYEW